MPSASRGGPHWRARRTWEQHSNSERRLDDQPRRGTQYASRQRGSALERHPPRHPLAGSGGPWPEEGRRLGRTPRRSAEEPLARGALGADAGRAGSGTLLATTLRDPLRAGDDSPLPREDRGGPPEEETELFPLRLGISAPPKMCACFMKSPLRYIA